MGVVERIVGIPLVRAKRQLIRSRFTNRPQDVLGVKAAVDKVLGQGAEQFGVRGWIAGADVVDRFDDSRAKQVTPQAIDIALGEISSLVCLRWALHE